MYTQCTYKCALSRLRECMLLSYHFYFFNLDNAFLKFWLTDLCMMDRKFIFLNCFYFFYFFIFFLNFCLIVLCLMICKFIFLNFGNCSYWLLEFGNYFF